MRPTILCGVDEDQAAEQPLGVAADLAGQSAARETPPTAAST